jgi:hypothetical protein
MSRNDDNYTLYWVQRLESDGQWADVRAFGEPRKDPKEEAQEACQRLRETQKNKFRIVKRVTTVEEE